VSEGLARGIYTVSHETAIAEGGFTIAVSGTAIYRDMRRQIADKHLVISEVRCRNNSYS
jgi:predicted Rossmann fold nucleotide-binding protein DprA/Smf involved in DNA uptake